MSDLISRQAAIDAISEKFDEIYKTKQKGATYPHDDFFQGMAYDALRIDAMYQHDALTGLLRQWKAEREDNE